MSEAENAGVGEETPPEDEYELESIDSEKTPLKTLVVSFARQVVHILLTFFAIIKPMVVDPTFYDFLENKES